MITQKHGCTEIILIPVPNTDGGDDNNTIILMMTTTIIIKKIIIIIIIRLAIIHLRIHFS